MNLCSNCQGLYVALHNESGTYLEDVYIDEVMDGNRAAVRFLNSETIIVVDGKYLGI